MPTDSQTPVLVGWGTAQQRFDDPVDAVEPIQLMIRALEAAGESAGAPGLLARADSIRAPRGFWDYPDPGRWLADHFGASGVRTQVAEVGVLQTTLFGGACEAIATGEAEVVLVTGGEAKYRSLRAQITGGEAPTTRQDAGEADEVLRPHADILLPEEVESGLGAPVNQYAMIENALRFANGQDLAAHQREVAELWSGFSEVAARNPAAWHREAVGPDGISTPSAGNRMIAWPYTKLHNSDWNVDQAAGLVFCSVAAARAAGVPEEHWVYPHAVTESNHMVPLSQRPALHRSPGFERAGASALEIAGVGVDEIEHLELYSCFPSAVRVQARELGIGPDRTLTETGGMRFAGGPLNNFVLQAAARMADVLVEDAGSRGLLTAISGIVTKQGVSIWSTRPPERGFRFDDVTGTVKSASRPLDVEPKPSGSGRVVSYTVVHGQGQPYQATLLCDLPSGARGLATTLESEHLTALMSEEFCGREVVLADGEVRSLGPR